MVCIRSVKSKYRKIYHLASLSISLVSCKKAQPSVCYTQSAWWALDLKMHTGVLCKCVVS